MPVRVIDERGGGAAQLVHCSRISGAHTVRRRQQSTSRLLPLQGTSRLVPARLSLSLSLSLSLGAGSESLDVGAGDRRREHAEADGASVDVDVEHGVDLGGAADRDRQATHDPRAWFVALFSSLLLLLVIVVDEGAIRIGLVLDTISRHLELETMMMIF